MKHNSKVDAGPEVTVISKQFAKILAGDVKPPSKQLHGLDNQPLKVIGELQAQMSYKRRETHQTIFVVHNLQHNMLGLPAIHALMVLTKVDSISKPVKEQFPSLSSELGTFQGDSYEIQLQPNAKPFAPFIPRNVPLLLRDKVRNEISRMETSGVISPVEEPTPWCSGMEVAPKKSGQVQISVSPCPN
jgi:hypothetical protein